MGIEPLQGGWSNRGRVFRRDDVVLRPRDDFTPSRGALLRHLKAIGFEASPDHFGSDAEGFERVEYLTGVTLDSESLPEWARSPAVLEAICRLVRQYDDLMTKFPLQDVDLWNYSLCSSEMGPLVIHNDICPENTVFIGERPSGFIDWEYAAPGYAHDDLAQALYTFVIAQELDSNPHLAVERLRLGYEAYGEDAFSWETLVAALIRRHDIRTAFRRMKVAQADPLFVESWRNRGGTLARSARRDLLVEL